MNPSQGFMMSFARALATLALVAAWLMPAAAPVAAAEAPPADAAPAGPALSQCLASLWCAEFTVGLFATGSGSVVSSTNGIPDGHIDCVLTNGAQSGACSYLYAWPAGTGTFHITLDAIPAMGNYVCFQGGTCLGVNISTPLAFDLTNDVPTNYAIDFQATMQKLTVTAVFNGGAAVDHVVQATNIESIECPPTCEWQYPYGTSVTLEVTSPDGWAFVGGFGSCQGSAHTCNLTMTDNQSAGFNFFPVAVVTSKPTSSAAASPHRTIAPTAGAGGSAAPGVTVPGASADLPGPTTQAGASADGGGPSPAAGAAPAASNTAATGPDPLVIGLLIVIAALLGVLAIGVLVVSRRRAA